MNTYDELRQQVEAILILSRQMLESAKATNWQEVICLESERRQRVEELFSKPIAHSLLSEISGKIEQILDIDRELMSLNAQTRDNLAQDMRVVIKGRTATRAYQQTIG